MVSRKMAIEARLGGATVCRIISVLAVSQLALNSVQLPLLAFTSNY